VSPPKTRFVGATLPRTVIKHLDVIDHIIAGFLSDLVIPMRRPLPLQRAKESLRHCIVQAISLTAHTTHDTLIAQHIPICMTRKLRATIRMMSPASGSGGVIHFLSPNANAVGGTLIVAGGAPGLDRGIGSDAGSGSGMGGRGGDGGQDGFAPTAGSIGVVIRSQIADPSSLLR
jgi:hypothetical protein